MLEKNLQWVCLCSSNVFCICHSYIIYITKYGISGVTFVKKKIWGCPIWHSGGTRSLMCTFNQNATLHNAEGGHEGLRRAITEVGWGLVTWLGHLGGIPIGMVGIEFLGSMRDNSFWNLVCFFGVDTFVSMQSFYFAIECILSWWPVKRWMFY